MPPIFPLYFVLHYHRSLYSKFGDPKLIVTNFGIFGDLRNPFLEHQMTKNEDPSLIVPYILTMNE